MDKDAEAPAHVSSNKEVLLFQPKINGAFRSADLSSNPQLELLNQMRFHPTHRYMCCCASFYVWKLHWNNSYKVYFYTFFEFGLNLFRTLNAFLTMLLIFIDLSLMQKYRKRKTYFDSQYISSIVTYTQKIKSGDKGTGMMYNVYSTILHFRF